MLLLATACTASAQTLARPGWAGSGLNADPWWKHSIFYAIDIPPTQDVDFEAITARLDTLQSLGVDALLLPMPALPVQGRPQAQSTIAPSAIDAAPPTPDAALDSFDELVQQASRRGVRILLTVSASGATTDLAAMVRFWLSRGVAGFRIVAPRESGLPASQPAVQILRSMTSSAVGERIVISDFSRETSSGLDTPRHRTDARTDAGQAEHALNSAIAQLQIDSSLNELDPPSAANIRALLEQSFLQPDVILDFHQTSRPGSPDLHPALAKVMAAIALTTHTAALIHSDLDSSLQTVAPGTSNQPVTGLTDWYRQMTELRHGNATLRYGRVAALNFDAQNALVWVTRPGPGAGLKLPVVVACNLSASPVQISLGAAINGLGLRGSFLRTLLRSDSAMGAQNLNSVTLPPFGVYIGELRR